MTGKEIYDSLARPPKDVLKQIGGGKLKSFTDINPQWRYEAMTEAFGLCGKGWYYKIVDKWDRECANGEVLVWMEIALYINVDGVWSEPISGTGGSKIVAIEKGELTPNDEGYKMAETDALSVAMKKIGVGADIYKGRWDGSKYTDVPQKNTTPEEPKPELAGGPTTPDERKKLIALFQAKKADGSDVFTKEEVQTFQKSRTEKTATILIQELEEKVKSRTSFNDENVPF